ncbi:MAG: M20 family metallopeptidase [Promethearchaeota archaeon]
MNEEQIIHEIEQNKQEYVRLLQEFIRIDTYNPPGNEKNLAIVIEKYLKSADIDCEVFPIQENRANLIAYLNNNFEEKNLLFNGHLDVVPPGMEGEWKNPPLSGYIKRNKFIFGRGATDMKGGLAAMVISMLILKKLRFEAKGNLILNAVADEETGGHLGTEWSLKKILEDRKIRCDFIVIGEPSGLNPLPKAIIIGEKGHLQVKIVTNGVSCHASMPFGVNPVVMMAKIIQNLDCLEKYIPSVDPPMTIKELKNLVSDAFPNKEIFEKIYEEQEILQNVLKSLTKFTYAFTMINAGIKENVIPDRCEGIIDFRLIPGQNTEMILEGLKQLIIKDVGYEVRESSVGKPEDVFVYLDIYHQSDPSIWEKWKDSEDLKMFYKIAEKITKKKPFYFLFPACADAHYYRNNRYCPQTILYGPGSASTAHSVDEFITIQDFINAIKIYTLFAYNFLK